MKFISVLLTGILIPAAAAWAQGKPAAGVEKESSDFIQKRGYHYYGPRLEGEAPGQPSNQRTRALRWMEGNVPGPEPGSQPWRSIGPRPTIVLASATSAGPPVASGRVTAIAVHPTEPDTVYLGSALGGVWKSVDAGRQWVPLTDQADSLAIGSLAIDPTHPDVIYAGTGEQNFSPSSYFGSGVLKSTDAGKTWGIVGEMFGGARSSNMGGDQIGALAVHPADGSILLAGISGKDDSHSGIFRSTDAGLTWKQVLAGAAGTSVLFNPENPLLAYAALGGPNEGEANGVYKSTDGGLTWTRATQGIPAKGVGRVSLAIGKPASILYAAISNPDSNDPLGVFRTVDNAENWTPLNTPGYCFATCWYANSIAVSPNNYNVALVGGLVLYLTLDGGKTWTNVSEGANGNMIHWDIHALAFGPDGTRVYAGTDGGIYRRENLAFGNVVDVGWTNLNATLSLTQFYPGCSARANTIDFIVCGTQDNGTQMFTGADLWRMVAGGDGGFTAVDSARPAVFYIAAAGMVSLQKSSPFTVFKGLLQINAGLEKVDTSDCFLPPLTLDHASPERLYFGCRRLFRTEDGGGMWQPVADELPDEAVFTFIAVAPSNSARVYATTSTGQVRVTSNALATNPSEVKWRDASQGLPARQLSSVAVDPANADVAVVTALGFSGFENKLRHVFRTTDGGATWTDISANLPNIPVNTVIFDHESPNGLIVGTDIGVFRAKDAERKFWERVGTGLPYSPVVDLKYHPAHRLLRAATHGRGMWEVTLPPVRRDQTTDIPSRLLFVLPTGEKAMVVGTGFSDRSVVRWNGEERPTRFVNSAHLEAALRPGDLAAVGRTSVTVRYPDRPGKLPNVLNLETGGAPEIIRVGNAAAGAVPAAALAAGTLATITGRNLAPRAATAPESSAGQTLAGAVVEFRSGVTHTSYPATIFEVSPERILFQVPPDLPLDPAIKLDVAQGTQMSQQVPVHIARFSPGLYSADGSGAGQAAAVCVSDGKLAGLLRAAPGARPAKRGELVRFTATGLGPFFSDLDPAKPAASTIATMSMTMGGVGAVVTESVALLPFVGKYQVTARVPARVRGGGPSGAATIAVSLSAGGVKSNEVTIAIR